MRTNCGLKSPQVLQHYQGRFRQILVDEFQDTNTVQYAWLRVLAGQAHTGGRRGGRRPVHLRLARGKDREHPALYRGLQCHQNDSAGAELPLHPDHFAGGKRCHRHNFGRLGKELWTAGESGEPISLYAGFNEHDEARYIVEQAEQWLIDGNTRASVAILYRSNAQSRVLEEALIRSDIPYRIYGGQRFYERMEIRNALAYLRLLVNRGDDAAVERVINTPPRGIGSKTLDTVRECARSRELPLWSAIAAVLEEKLLPARALSALEGFVSAD